MTKANVLRLLLQEAKKNNCKWLVQQEGENLFPNDDDPDDYDNWQYTENIKETIKYVENIGNHASIIFYNKSMKEQHGWALYIKHYDEHSEEDISDYSYGTNLEWLDDFSANLEVTHG